MALAEAQDYLFPGYLSPFKSKGTRGGEKGESTRSRCYLRLLFALWLNLRSEELSIFFPYPKPGNLENRAREGRRWDCFVHPPKQLKGRAGELFVRLF